MTDRPVVVPDRIRALQRCRIVGGYLDEGEEDELEWEEAARLIEWGDVEPVFDFAPYKPSLPPGECSLWDTFLSYVGGYPKLQAFREAKRRPLRGRYLYIREYRELRRWDLNAYGNRARRRRHRGGVVGSADHSGFSSLGRDDSPSFLERYNGACIRYFFHAAIYNFLGLLDRGEWVWSGVPEGQLEQTELVAIPARWLRRDVVLLESDLWEIISRNPKNSVRLFLDIVVADPAVQGPERAKAYTRVAECYDNLPPDLKARQSKHGGKAEIAALRVDLPVGRA